MAECPYVLCLCVLTQLGLTPWVLGARPVKGCQGGWEGHGDRPVGPGAAERQGLGLTPQWPTEIYIHLGLGTVSLELLYGQLDSR